VPPQLLHVTVAYSRKEVEWDKLRPQQSNLIITQPNSIIHSFGEKDIVMKFDSKELYYDWEYYMMCGCSYDFEKYQPHVSIKYVGKPVDISKIEPFNDILIFGPELLEELDLNWRP
jgi:hypothetical protein